MSNSSRSRAIADLRNASNVFGTKMTKVTKMTKMTKMTKEKKRIGKKKAKNYETEGDNIYEKYALAIPKVKPYILLQAAEKAEELYYKSMNELYKLGDNTEKTRVQAKADKMRNKIILLADVKGRLGRTKKPKKSKKTKKPKKLRRKPSSKSRSKSRRKASRKRGGGWSRGCGRNNNETECENDEKCNWVPPGVCMKTGSTPITYSKSKTTRNPQYYVHGYDADSMNLHWSQRPASTK